MLADIYAPTWEKHDGKRVTINGLAHTIKVTTGNAVYPYKHRYIRVEAVPCSKSSKHYREVRSELGDDWSTDLLASDIDLRVDVLRQLGE